MTKKELYVIAHRKPILTPKELDDDITLSEIDKLVDLSWSKLLRLQKSSDACTKQKLNKTFSVDFDNLVLNFIERDKANMHYTVVMKYKSVGLSSNERLVLHGNIIVCGSREEAGYIEFDFRTRCYYRVSLSTGGNIRRINPLICDPCHADMFRQLEEQFYSFLDTSPCSPDLFHPKDS